MEDLLQHNLLYLYHNKTDVFQNIQKYMNANIEKNCKIEYSDSGAINLSYLTSEGTIFLYASDGSDIEQWIEQYAYLSEGHYDVVLFGLGLSHHLAKLIQLNPDLHFHIFEPSIDVFIESLKVIQIEQLLEHPQVKLFKLGNTSEDIATFYTFVHTYSKYEIKDVFIPYYTELEPEVISDFYKSNYLFREHEAIKYGFEKRFGVTPYRNSIRNLAVVQESCSLRYLNNKFKGLTALIVGSGPSLEKDIELIKQHKDELLIISAGSSIQALLKSGITPQFCVSMDPGVANGRVYEKFDVSQLNLVFIPQIYSPIVNMPFQRLFYAFFNNDPIIDYLYPMPEGDIKLMSNNSVSGTAIQVAAYLGVETILFTGQDLSFPNNQYYSSGTQHSSGKFLEDTVKTSNMEVENVNGSYNKTNIGFKSALQDIERLIATIEDVEFINTSSLGAKINGASYKPFSEAIQTVSKYIDAEKFQHILDYKQKMSEFSYEYTFEKVATTIDICNEMEKNIDLSLDIIMKIDTFARSNPHKASNLLSKLENQFAKITNHLFFKEIIPKWSHSLTKKYDREVIRIEAEQTIIGKARLLNEIVVPYMNNVKQSFAEIKIEFQQVQDKLIELPK